MRDVIKEAVAGLALAWAALAPFQAQALQLADAKTGNCKARQASLVVSEPCVPNLGSQQAVFEPVVVGGVTYYTWKLGGAYVSTGPAQTVGAQTKVYLVNTATAGAGDEFLWRPYKAAAGALTWQWESKAWPGRCVNTEADSTAAGAKVEVWTCTGAGSKEHARREYVQPMGVSATRPGYPITSATVLGKYTGGRVAVGAPCACDGGSYADGAMCQVAGTGLAATCRPTAGVRLAWLEAPVASVRATAAITVASAASVSGTLTAGQVLTGTPASFANYTGTVTNEWLRGATVVGTGTTYTLTAADVGATITFRSTADTVLSSATTATTIAAAPTGGGTGGGGTTTTSAPVDPASITMGTVATTPPGSYWSTSIARYTAVNNNWGTPNLPAGYSQQVGLKGPQSDGSVALRAKWNYPQTCCGKEVLAYPEVAMGRSASFAPVGDAPLPKVLSQVTSLKTSATSIVGSASGLGQVTWDLWLGNSFTALATANRQVELMMPIYPVGCYGVPATWEPAGAGRTGANVCSVPGQGRNPNIRWGRTSFGGVEYDVYYAKPYPTKWAANTSYTVGQRVAPSGNANGKEYVVTVAGTSGGGAPDFTTVNTPTTTNNATWTSGSATFRTAPNYWQEPWHFVVLVPMVYPMGGAHSVEWKPILDFVQTMGWGATGASVVNAAEIGYEAILGQGDITVSGIKMQVNEGTTTTATLTAPASVAGTAMVGQTLTGTPATYSGGGTVTNEFLRGTTVVGTGTTYAVKNADIGAPITFRSTPTSGTASSAATTAVVNTPVPYKGQYATEGTVRTTQLLITANNTVVENMRISDPTQACIRIQPGVRGTIIRNSDIGPCGESSTGLLTDWGNDVGVWVMGADTLIDHVTFHDLRGAVNVANGAQHPFVLRNSLAWDIRGPEPRGQLVQMNTVNTTATAPYTATGGPQSKIINNVSDKDLSTNPYGYSNPDPDIGPRGTGWVDHVNLYGSSGTSTDPILIGCNKFRGGDDPSGSGIILGDNGGQYFTVQDNIFVMTANVGMVGCSGCSNALIQRNLQYSRGTSASSFTSGSAYVMRDPDTPTLNPTNVTFANNRGVANGWLYGGTGQLSNPGFFNDGNAVNLTLTNNNWMDTTLTPAIWDTTPAACPAQ